MLLSCQKEHAHRRTRSMSSMVPMCLHIAKPCEHLYKETNKTESYARHGHVLTTANLMPTTNLWFWLYLAVRVPHRRLAAAASVSGVLTQPSRIVHSTKLSIVGALSIIRMRVWDFVIRL